MNDNLEKICNDKNTWVHFESGYGSAKIYTRCQCGKFLKHGKVIATITGIRFENWICSKCGEVEPFYLIDE